MRRIDLYGDALQALPHEAGRNGEVPEGALAASVNEPPSFLFTDLRDSPNAERDERIWMSCTWHGAAPGQEFIQVGVRFGGDIKFAEPVTGAEYQVKAK